MRIKHFSIGVFISLLLLSGCTVPMNMDSVVKEPHFAGVVVEVYDNSILVSVNEGEEARKSSDLINVSLNVELKDSMTEFISGDEVIVYYDGTIAESYPAQLLKVYAIVLTSSREELVLTDENGNMIVQYATYEPTAPFGTGDGAELRGMLKQRYGCIVVETEEGNDVLPFFPADITTWDKDNGALIIDGQAYPLNSLISFGGGYTSKISEDYTIPELYGDPEEAFIVTWAAFLAKLHRETDNNPDNPSPLSSWKPLADLPFEYRKEQAATDGVYVNIHGAEKCNQALVDTFYMDALSGFSAFMRTMEYTVEGDPIITDYQYDGMIFSVTTDISRDKFKGIESEDIFTATYKYLLPYVHSRPQGFPPSFVLSNEENIYSGNIGPTELIDGLGHIPSPSIDAAVNAGFFQTIKNKLFDGYNAVTITDWTQLYGKALVKPAYLPERFRYFEGLFVKDNPGMPGNTMTAQLWYDPQTFELLAVTQHEIDGGNGAGMFVFSDKFDSGEMVQSVFPWVSYVVTYPVEKNGLSMYGYMLVCDKYQKNECELIVTSLANDSNFISNR